MELNGLNSPIGTAPQGSPCTFYVEATIKEAASLDSQTLKMTNGGTVIAIYPDYKIINIKQEREGLISITAQRVLDPDTKSTFERIEQEQKNQADISDVQQTQLDLQGDVLDAIIQTMSAE